MNRKDDTRVGARGDRNLRLFAIISLSCCEPATRYLTIKGPEPENKEKEREREQGKKLNIMRNTKPRGFRSSFQPPAKSCSFFRVPVFACAVRGGHQLHDNDHVQDRDLMVSGRYGVVPSWKTTMHTSLLMKRLRCNRRSGEREERKKKERKKKNEETLNGGQ
jgi:hypothetical protein